MKLRLLAAAAAATALTMGAVGVGSAGAADYTHVTQTLSPYALGVIGVGSTHPGFPDSQLCLVTAATTNVPVPGTPVYGGLINGVHPAGRSTNELNINYVTQNFNALSTGDQGVTSGCVATAINFNTVDPSGTAGTQAIDSNIATPTKHGGTLQVASVTDLQPGILATSTNRMRVDYAAGQSVKLPALSNVVDGAVSGDTHVTFDLKPTVTTSKAQIDTAVCTDREHFIDTANLAGGGPLAAQVFGDAPDNTPGAHTNSGFTSATRAANVVTLSGGNGASLVDGRSITVAGGPTVAGTSVNGTFTLTSHTSTSVTYSQTGTAGSASLTAPAVATVKQAYTLGDPGVFVATLRECAEKNVIVPGKAATIKIGITGAGHASASFVQAFTTNPQTWDTTRGSSCTAQKTASSNIDALSATRVLACKGDWGEPIPLSIDVKIGDPVPAGDSPHLDQYGLLHQKGPIQLLQHTFA